jgi:alpha-D-ribose 1-methylphosphonate 5-triphosphate synthase subunit PhnH
MAVSRPGTVLPVPELTDSDNPVTDLLGCLMDIETTFAVIGDDSLASRMSRRTESRLSPADTADFILAPAGSTGDRMATFKRGTLEYPDRSATVVYGVESLGCGGLSVTLTGPGVDGETTLEITGIGRNEFHRLQEMNDEFPLGIDAIFVDRNGRIAALPRTTRTGGF